MATPIPNLEDYINKLRQHPSFRELDKKAACDTLEKIPFGIILHPHNENKVNEERYILSIGKFEKMNSKITHLLFKVTQDGFHSLMGLDYRGQEVWAHPKQDLMTFFNTLMPTDILQEMADFLNEIHKPCNIGRNWTIFLKQEGGQFCQKTRLLDYRYLPQLHHRMIGINAPKVKTEFSELARSLGFNDLFIKQFQESLITESYKYSQHNLILNSDIFFQLLKMSAQYRYSVYLSLKNHFTHEGLIGIIQDYFDYRNLDIPQVSKEESVILNTMWQQHCENVRKARDATNANVDVSNKLAIV